MKIRALEIKAHLREILRFADEFMSFVFPGLCPLCGERLKSFDESICESCSRKLERNQYPYCLSCGKPIHSNPPRCCDNSPLDFVYAVGSYRKGWGELVEQFKLNRKISLQYFLGYELGKALKCFGFFADFQYLLPVPTDRTKKRERGYSQTLLLAKVASKVSGLPCIPDALKRVNFRRSQIGLGAEERRKNVVNTFAVVEGRFPRGANIIILDDVTTTGATLLELGKTMKNAGSGRLAAIVVAKA